MGNVRYISSVTFEHLSLRLKKGLTILSVG
jgi:hypothetical protein